MTKITFDSLLRDAGKVVVSRELFERAMHQLEESDLRDARLTACEMQNLLDEIDTELGS